MDICNIWNSISDVVWDPEIIGHPAIGNWGTLVALVLSCISLYYSITRFRTLTLGTIKGYRFSVKVHILSLKSIISTEIPGTPIEVMPSEVFFQLSADNAIRQSHTNNTNSITALKTISKEFLGYLQTVSHPAGAPKKNMDIWNTNIKELSTYLRAFQDIEVSRLPHLATEPAIEKYHENVNGVLNKLLRMIDD